MSKKKMAAGMVTMFDTAPASPRVAHDETLCPQCGERPVPAWPRCCPVCERAGWLAVERTSPPYIVTRELIEEAARLLEAEAKAEIPW